MKNVNVCIVNSVFPRRAFIDDGAYALAALSTFQGEISQLPPGIGNTRRIQERALPNCFLSHPRPLHGFINWVALLSYLDDSDIAVFEL